MRIGESHRARMSIGADGAVIIAERQGEKPAQDDGVTHLIRVRVEDVSSQFGRARAHGARAPRTTAARPSRYGPTVLAPDGFADPADSAGGLIGGHGHAQPLFLGKDPRSHHGGAGYSRGHRLLDGERLGQQAWPIGEVDLLGHLF